MTYQVSWRSRGWQASKTKDLEKKRFITKTVVLGRLRTLQNLNKKNPTKSQEQTLSSLGIDIRNINDDDAKNRSKLRNKSGVIIKKIDPNGAMSLLAVRPGDAIVALQNTPIKNTRDFEKN